MTMQCKMFQIFFQSEHLSSLDKSFIPYDNTTNERPDLREFFCWKKIHNTSLTENCTHWGAVSWRFTDKTRISGQSFLNFVNNNPDYDLYYVCPFNYKTNVWVQGDLWHPNLSVVADYVLKKLNYNVKSRELIINNGFFCNFFAANIRFWDLYIAIIDSIFNLSRDDEYLNTALFKLDEKNYKNDRALGLFPFIIERLTPTIVILENFKSIGYLQS